jgi:type I restriction enzyme R subunit
LKRSRRPSTPDVLRHGFKFFGKKIDCAYFKPAHGMNPDILAKYAENRLVVTRQVKFIVDYDASVDVVLFVNGLPPAGKNVTGLLGALPRPSDLEPVAR